MTKPVLIGALVICVLCGLLFWTQETAEETSPGMPTEARFDSQAPETASEPASEAPKGIVTSEFTPDEKLPELASLDAADRDLDLFGKVVDPEGNPVAGADVRTVRFPWRRISVLNHQGYYDTVEMSRSRTSRQGLFILRHRRGEQVDLRVRAEGFATQTAKNCVAGERVVIELERSLPFTIVAVDESRKPVADVAIRHWRYDRSAPRTVTYDYRNGTTDAEGRCVFADLTPGESTLEFEHATLGSPGWKKLEIVPGGQTTFEIVMPTGRSIRGVVGDASTGRPIEGATIGSNWTLDRPVRSDAQGHYVFPGWSGNGVREIVATAEGYGRERVTVPESGDVNFVLQPADEARGRVVSSKGQPVPTALVTAVGSIWGQGNQKTDSISVRTGADGAFELLSLSRDMPHTLVIQARGHGRYLLDFDIHPGKPGVIDLGEISLPEARAIEGRVVGTSDEVVAGAAVTVTGWNSDRFRLRKTSGSALKGFHYARSETRRTDDLGRFRFPDLSPGSYTVKATLKGRAPHEVSVELSQQDLLDVELRFRETPPFAVRLRDDAGRWIPDIDVRLTWPGIRDSLKQRTDENGRAVFDGVPREGRLQIEPSVYDKDYVDPTQRMYDREGDEIMVVLQRAALISGQVVNHKGEPQGGIVVEAQIDGQNTANRIADSKGNFKIKVPPNQAIDLVVTGTQFRRGGGRGTETLQRGRLDNVVAPASDLVIKTEPVADDRTLSVLVLDPQGSPVSGVNVWISGTSTHKQGRTDADGRVQFEGLAAQQVTVMATPPKESEYASPQRERTVPKGQIVTLRYRPATTITGVVLDREGQPVPQARVEAMTGDYDGMAVIAGADGRFSLRVAANQIYTVTAEKRDPKTSRRSVATKPDVSSGEITLRFQ